MCCGMCCSKLRVQSLAFCQLLRVHCLQFLIHGLWFMALFCVTLYLSIRAYSLLTDQGMEFKV